MEPSSISENLLDYGALGIFAIFLIWQHLSMQKRFDSLVQKFQEQIKNLQTKADEDEEKLRDRYDTVIAQYQDDKTTMRTNMGAQVIRIINDISAVADKVDVLPFDTILLQIESLSMSQAASHSILEKGMQILDAREDEKKLQEMARKLSQDS